MTLKTNNHELRHFVQNGGLQKLQELKLTDVIRQSDIKDNLLELINPYVLDNKTWAYLQTDNRFPIMYNEGVIYTPTIKNEMKVVYEC